MSPSRPRRHPRLVLCLLLAALLPAAGASAQETVGHRAHSFSGFGAENGGPVTGEKPESKLWFHDGVWWTAMVSPAQAGDHTIHRLEGTTWADTGVVVDDPTGRADALLVGDTLYLTGRNTSRLTRLSYTNDRPATGDGTWAVDSGFPVTVPVATTEALTIARDSAGRLWLAWTEDSEVRTATSADDGSTWSAASTVPAGAVAAVTGDDIAAVVAFHDDTGPAVGIMWSNQSTSTQHFAIHRDGAPLDEWTIESALRGPRHVDDHINLKTFEGRVYAVVKTAVRKASTDPLIRLLVRDSDGGWSSHPVAIGQERDSRPITVLQIDPATRQIYVFMTRNPADDRRQIVYKRTSIDGIRFPADATLFIYADRGVNDATSLKANATARSGIVVMATTSRDYWWNRVGGSSEPAPDPKPLEHTLTVSVDGPGTVALDPPGGTYESGTEVTLTATADTEASFTGWSGDLGGTANPASLVVDADKTVTATFTADDPGDPSDPGGEDPSPAGSVELTQVVTGGAVDTDSVATSDPAGAAADAVYLAAISTRSVVDVTGIDGLGLSWQPVVTQCAGRSQTAVSLWVAAGSPTTGGHVRAAFAGSVASSVIAVSRYAGADPAQPIGSTTGVNTRGVDGACSGGNDSDAYDATLTHPSGDHTVHLVATMRGKTHSPATGYSEHAETAAGSGGTTTSLAVADRPADPTGTTPVTGTFSGTVDWAVAATTVRAAPE